MADHPPDPQAVLSARLQDYQLGFFLSLGLALVSGVPLLFSASEYVAIAFVLCGIGLCVGTGAKVMAVRRDLQEGPVTERCRVTATRALRREFLCVRTARGQLWLTNATDCDGRSLLRRWVMLTYAPHSRMALRVQDA